MNAESFFFKSFLSILIFVVRRGDKKKTKFGYFMQILRVHHTTERKIALSNFLAVSKSDFT